MSAAVITRFSSATAKVGDRLEVTREQLVHRLRDAPPEALSKEELPLLFPGELADNRRRATAVQRLHLIVGEHDLGEVSFDEAVRRVRVAGLDAIVYTSPSHTEAAPRWRVICWLAAPAEPAAFTGLVDALNGALGGCMPAECWTRGRIWYYGRIRGRDYRCEVVDGEPLDTHPFLPEPIGNPGGAKTERERPTTEEQNTDASELDLDAFESAALHLADRGFYTLGAGRYASHWIPLLAAAARFVGTGMGERARSIAVEASERGGGNAEETDAKVADLAANPPADAGYTFRTVIQQATGAGWTQPPKVSKPGAFQPVELTEEEQAADAAVAATAKAAIANVQAKARAVGKIDMTDSGNAALFALKADGNVRYVLETKSWIYWDGKAWRDDPGLSTVTRFMHEVAEHWRKLGDEEHAKVEGLAEVSAKADAAKAAREHWAYAKAIRSKAAIDNALALAVRAPGILVRAAELDTDRALLGVANGVVDLRTGELVDVGRDKLVTRRSPVAFDPAAACPRFERFVSEITAGAEGERQPLAAYLQRCIGYWATGEVQEQKMFILNGAGSNGKNVLTDMVGVVLGPYRAELPPAILLESKNLGSAEAPSPFARTLAGCRVGVTSETKAGARFDPAVIKAHTGNAQMPARGLYEKPFTFNVTHKLVLMTNELPALDALDAALRGRLHVIPFDRRWNRPGLPEEERDPSLPDGDKGLIATLRAEEAGILAWIVRGAVAYYREGLEPPAEVSAATMEYFDQQDAIGQWLATMERCEPLEGTQPTALHRRFLDWCQMRDQRPGKCETPHGFGRALDRLGVKAGKAGSGQRLRGLRCR